jgi:hypothetical protein
MEVKVGKVSKKSASKKKLVEEDPVPQEETFQPTEVAVEESIETAPVDKKKKKKGKKRQNNPQDTTETGLEAQPTESVDALTEAAPEPEKPKKSKKKSKENGTHENGKEEQVAPTVTKEDVEEFRMKNSISTTSDEYTPIMSFETLYPQVSTEMADFLKQFKFEKPSFIQSEVWGYLFSKPETLRKDVVAIAETGSGKTLGFVVPTISALLDSRESSNNVPFMIIYSIYSAQEEKNRHFSQDPCPISHSRTCSTNF